MYWAEWKWHLWLKAKPSFLATLRSPGFWAHDRSLWLGWLNCKHGSINTEGLLSRVPASIYMLNIDAWWRLLGIVLVWEQNKWYCCAVAELIYSKGSTVAKITTRWSRFRNKKVLSEKKQILVLFPCCSLLLFFLLFAVFSGLKLSFHFSVAFCIPPRAARTVLV